MKYFYLLVAAMLLIGCSQSDENQTTQDESISRDDLLGTWVIMAINGEEVSTNEYFAFRLNDDNSQDYFALGSDENGSLSLIYTDNAEFWVEDDCLYLYSDIVDMQYECTISTGQIGDISGELLTYTEVVNIQDGEDFNEGRTFSAIRSTVDYAADIVGLWEGVVIEGDEIEPYDNIRLEFKEDNSYNFYAPADDGSWTLLEQGNRYVILGNILGTQWTESDSTQWSEIWLTTIDGDTMTWRANRTTTTAQAGFDLTRIE